MTVTETVAKPLAQRPSFPIESLLSARLMLSPRLIGEKVYFLSDMGGVLSLYSMDKKGGIPQPLLPGGLALVNPHLMNGDNFVVLPNLGRIMIMVDKNGNENYQPSFIPMDGGFPQPIFGKDYENEQIACIQCDHENNVAFFERDVVLLALHIEGLKRLERDPRIDSSRRGVVGRSYGGYMTLTLAARHPSLWKAAVDMFGPYDLSAWLQRLPPSWLPYMRLAVGDPDKEQGLLVERSPKTSTIFQHLS